MTQTTLHAGFLWSNRNVLELNKDDRYATS